MPRRLLQRAWKYAKRFKEAWGWWGIAAALGIVPAVPVVLLMFEGQPLSILALYGMAAIAFWVVIFTEVPQIAEYDKRKRRKILFAIEGCCLTEQIGLENTTDETIPDVLVYGDVLGNGVSQGQVFRWLGVPLGQPLTLNPGPPHHHVELLLHDIAGKRVYLRPAHELAAGEIIVRLYVKGTHLLNPPQYLSITVGSDHRAVVKLIERPPNGTEESDPTPSSPLSQPAR